MAVFPIVATVFLLLSPSVLGRTILPKDYTSKWHSKIQSEVKDFKWEIYTNGRGKMEKGKLKCNGKWKDAVAYGAQKKEIRELCVRLHEKHQDDRGYEDSPTKYNCILDPNDKGNDHGRKNRDWLCYEKAPKAVLLPPHGPSLESDCPAENPIYHRARCGVSIVPEACLFPHCVYRP
ncbi:hypothetical protein Pmar_PMAR007575 [Perkinsus marinus ATCC 50983]|uniref:Secreted protein n=1 Tax=Perkinsus marinus (strain ATCC 50983 / TXsc) TaxID=423536 RepID=C5LKD7_PERM5|nr:hypothetical protein Pmar_PMAR007575 [Perkinsus marinus ATCC 50983]EER02819.1 hypothetical protein Pmar_PMAR007575 [Perkinsus marinus ATCC 50983]|eukprot:XP_002771003.1 hypothetical protein Pmar_PMAR007575 [Perkinsus marinus ATCC 50983]